MGVDLDNLSEEEDYLSALMEAVNTLQIKDASDPRIGFLADEIRKVRQKRKAADPKFKAKKTKISADSFKKGSATTASVGQKALPPAIKPKTSIIPYVKPDEVDDEEEGGKKKKARTRKKTDKDQKLLEKIAKSVSNIADILKEQYGLKKKKASYDRKKAEADKRKLKESNLEKSFKGLASAAEKIIAPVKGALDSILDFFINIIIGRFLVKFIRWFGDPKNAKKVDSVIRFLVDHGPKLLAAFLLFGTSIGRFAVRLSALLLKGALKLGAAAAKFAFKFAMRNPAAAAITAIVGGAAIGGIMQANTQSNDPDAPEGRTQLEDTMDYGGVTGDPIAGAFQYGGTIPYYNDGGGVGSGKITTNSGSDITGAGPDTQLIAAQPGEIVINKRTVDAVGADHFLGLNQQYGGAGANKPKTATVQTASGGGFVLPAFSSGGLVSGHEEKQPGGGGFPAISVSHPNTGSGFGLDGVVDYKGRPAVFSKNAASAFGKMITDSGGAVKGSDIASSQRSRSYNRKVGGVSNSNHLYGNALDIHGTSQTWMRANGRKYGWIVNDYPGSHGGHFNYKGAGASQMNTPDEGSPVATGQGGQPLGSTTQRAGTGLRSGGPSGPGESSVVLALKNGVQGKLNTATGKFTPAEFSPAERARYTKMGGTIPETKPKAEPQNKLLSTLTGAATGAAVGGMFGGPLGALIGGVAGGVLGSGILGGKSDPNKPKRSSFPMGRSGAKKYSEAVKKYNEQKQQAAAEKKKVSDANKPKRSDFPTGRTGGKAYSEALKKHQSGDSTTAKPATPISATATKRHAELMKSTDQKRIADYDAKHGAGAYSKKLQEKLNKMYSPEKAKQMTTGKVKPTGKVVGRENLPRKAQEALARLDAQKAGGQTPDMQYTRNGKKISAEQFNKVKSGNIIPGGGKPGGLFGGMMDGMKNMFGGMGKPPGPAPGQKVVDGNIGKPTRQEQKDLDALAANKAKLRAKEAKLGTMGKDLVTPGPPPGGGSNVKVVRAPSPAGGSNPNDKNTGGSDVDAAQTGNGNKAKWNILGIPMPF